MTMKHRIVGIGLAVALWAAAPGTAPAGVWCVSKAGSDGIGDGSTNAPWASITNAVVHCGAGDTIQVAAGVYTQNVVLATTNVTIQGGYDPSDWSWNPANQATVLFGNSNSPVTIPVAATNTLRYLTLRGGTKASQAGVVLNATNCGAIVEGCVITGNTYGVYIAKKVAGANLVMRNTLVARNSSYGIYAYTYDKTPGKCWLYNCTIADNKGSGYYAYSVNGVAGQLLVASNTLFTGNAGFGVFMSFCYSSPSTVANSLFYGNGRGPWNQYFRDDGGNKFSQDPKYVDAAHGDYRLQSSSPAAAAGADLSAAGLTNDILNVARPGPNGWDMGAYQGSGTGAPPAVGVGYVSKSGNDGTGDGSTNNPWASITYGLGCLNATGTLYVASGVYTDNVWMGEGRRIIRGGYNPSDWSWDPASQRTVIDGCVTNPPVTILSWRSTNTLNGLTLRNGLATSGDDGAGLRLSGWSNGNGSGSTGCVVFVDACTITGNTYGIQDRALWATMTVATP